MKKKIELDVDFIGDGSTPTEEEFLAISEFIKAHKAKMKLNEQRKTKIIKRNAKKSS